MLFFLMLLARYRQQIPNLLIALSMGIILCELLSPLSIGLFKFVTLLCLVRGLAWICKQHPNPWILALVGYSFAWVGHYFFEQNRPATFIYPSYSLLCDFRMWWDTLTEALPLTADEL
jgi:hypothetical protein